MHRADTPPQDAAAHGKVLDEVGNFEERARVGHSGAPTNSTARQQAEK